MTRQEALRRQGWERQVTYDEPRLSQIVEMYVESGFEVLLEPFDPLSEPGQCSHCMRESPERFKTIYTRSLSPKG
jgi:hypothetical protein